MGLLGGNSDVSSAQAQASLNSSGWTVGGGKSRGGSLSSLGGLAVPWYGWVSIAFVGAAWWRFAQRKKRGK